MSVTLQQLRRNIGVRTQQPFFKLFGGGPGTTTALGTTTTLIDTTLLKQANDYWNGQYVYLPNTQAQRNVSDFVNATSTITWLSAVSGAVAGSTPYELWSQFTPAEVHAAINQSLRDAWPFFFSVEEKFLVIQGGVGTGYSLSGLSPAPRFLGSVYVEHWANSVTGQVTTVVAQNRLKDTNQTFTSADVGKEIRIYEGTSQGDIRTISALVDSNTIEVSTNFTATLSTTSKYRMVDITVPEHGYVFTNQWSVDKFSNPTKLRLSGHPYGSEGYTIRLLYEAEYPTLSAEADATTAPQEWLELATLARLFAMKIAGAPASELRNWVNQWQLNSDAAQAFAAKNRFNHISSTYSEDQMGRSNVRSQEYPF